MSPLERISMEPLWDARAEHHLLLSLGWFAAAYRWFIPWKDVWLNAIRASWPWRVGRVIKFRVKRAVAAIWRGAVQSVRTIFRRS